MQVTNSVLCFKVFFCLVETTSQYHASSMVLCHWNVRCGTSSKQPANPEKWHQQDNARLILAWSMPSVLCCLVHVCTSLGWGLQENRQLILILGYYERCPRDRLCRSTNLKRTTMGIRVVGNPNCSSFHASLVWNKLREYFLCIC
jgi:hypothetical protein